MSLLPLALCYFKTAQIMIGAFVSRRSRRKMARALAGRSSREVPVTLERAWR